MANTNDISLVWIWIIEYFASLPQLDLSLLLDLMELAPELPYELAENMREMVALRILEEVSSLAIGDGISDDFNCKVSLDLSARCGDVLTMLMGEVTGFGLLHLYFTSQSLQMGLEKMDMRELLKWDVRSFILHKRALMPKCALEQLKEAAHDGNHLYSVLLKAHNERLCAEKHNKIPEDLGDCMRTSEGNSNVQRNVQRPTSTLYLSGKDNGVLTKRNLLPSKRDRSDLADNNVFVDVHKAPGYVRDDDQFHGSAKRNKEDSVCIDHSTLQISVPLCSMKLIEDCFRKVVGVPEIEDYHVGKETQVRDFLKSGFSEGGHFKCSFTERFWQGTSIAVIDEDQHNDDEAAHTACERPEDASIDGTYQHIPVNKSSRTSISKSSDNQLKSQKVNDHNRKFSSDQVDNSEDHFHEENSSSDSDDFHPESFDVAMEKTEFMSSQCELNCDSLATSGWTEYNMCVKCKKEGQVLVCSTDGCPLVVHEGCLGFAASFDELGHFYCPFCAYSSVVTNYSEAKKNASLARKELTEFILMGLEDRSKDQNSRLYLKNDGNSRKSGREDISKTPANVSSEMTECNQIKSGEVSDHHGLNIKGANIMSPVNNENTNEGMQKELSQQFTESSEKPVCVVNNDEEETSDDVSNYFIRVRRKRECTNSPIPQLRRKKLAWTIEEEEKLKEGIQRFSSDSDKNIPWKLILEDGSCVFKGRTAVDLKDKWRNMCKRSLRLEQCS